MALSTNSIIHYTKNIKNVELILKEGFKVKYCYEKVLSSEKGHIHSAFPMVSFCDIPLSQVKEHLNSYGCYGLGLKKDWAKKNKLSPVLYFDRDSELINYIREEFGRLNEKMKNKEFDFCDFEHLITILSYSKNYEGDLNRSGEILKNYRFFDEREWRYVPNKEKLGEASPWVTQVKYNADKVKYNNALNHIRLAFDVNDISYIVVKTEDEIKEMTQIVRNIFSDQCSLQKMEILLTKIITTDQILYDF